MRGRLSAAALLVGLALVCAPAHGANQTVTASGLSFAPASVTVNQGEMVTWNNTSGVHNVHFDDNSYDQPPTAQAAPWTVSRTFTQTGSFRYYCELHGGPNGAGMSGIVNVTTPYPRPNGAAKTRLTLVPAARECIVPNTDHGPPFPNSSNDACSATGLVTDNLTVPNDDTSVHNASVTFRQSCSNGGTPPTCGAAGDQADARIIATVNDVRCAGSASGSTPCGAANTSPGSDYVGMLLLKLPLRITDRYNGPSNDVSATLPDREFTLGIPCTATAGDLSRGSSCSANTSTDALVPDFAREDTRAMLALGQVEVQDMGDNGTLAAGTIAGPGGTCGPACRGDGDEQAFLRQGIFVP